MKDENKKMSNILINLDEASSKQSSDKVQWDDNKINCKVKEQRRRCLARI